MIRARLVIVAAAILLLASRPAVAQSVVIWDADLTLHGPFTQADPLPATPRNWVSPIDYTAGRVYVRLDVNSKPSQREVHWRVQFFFPGMGGIHHAGPLSGPVVNPGNYENLYTFPQMWKGAPANYANGIAKLMLTIYDPTNTPIQGGNDVYPMSVHITVTLVPPGGSPGDAGARSLAPASVPGLDVGQLKHLTRVAEMIRARALGKALNAAVAAAAGKDADAAREGADAADALRKNAADQQADIEKLKPDDPVAACNRLGDLAQQYDGSDVGAALAAEHQTWAKDPVMIAEFAAAPVFARLNTAYQEALKKGDPSDPAAVKKSQYERGVIADAARILQEKFPATQANRKAQEICRKLSIH